jgi:hypothetical protein
MEPIVTFGLIDLIGGLTPYVIQEVGEMDERVISGSRNFSQSLAPIAASVNNQ